MVYWLIDLFYLFRIKKKRMIALLSNAVPRWQQQERQSLSLTQKLNYPITNCTRTNTIYFRVDSITVLFMSNIKSHGFCDHDTKHSQDVKVPNMRRKKTLTCLHAQFTCAVRSSKGYSLTRLFNWTPVLVLLDKHWRAIDLLTKVRLTLLLLVAIHSL